MRNYLTKIVMVLVLGTMLFACETNQVVTPKNNNEINPINLVGTWDWKSTEYSNIDSLDNNPNDACTVLDTSIDSDLKYHRILDKLTFTTTTVGWFDVCIGYNQKPKEFDIEDNLISVYNSSDGLLYQFEVLESNFITPVKRLKVKLVYSSQTSLVDAIHNFTK